MIPYIGDMYGEAEFNAFVRLLVWSCGGDWAKAQDRWSRELAREINRKEGFFTHERIISETIAKLMPALTAEWERAKH